MKVNPRATYFAEAWGNQYDFGRYISVLPTPTRVMLQSTDDLERIEPVDPTGGAFGEQLDALSLNRARTRPRRADHPDHLLAAVDRRVARRRSGRVRHTGPAPRACRSCTEPFARRPSLLERALDAITETLVAYTRPARQAGADGVFFAIVRLAREGALTREEHERFGRPYDLRVLEAVADAPLNVLHICGDHVYFDAMADYPVRAISWNSEAPGNPSFGEAARSTPTAVMGGVAEDTTLPKGTPRDVTRAVETALGATVAGVR